MRWSVFKLELAFLTCLWFYRKKNLSLCAAHPGSWSHLRSLRSHLHHRRSMMNGCTAKWSCRWWNPFLSPPACKSKSNLCGLNTKHITRVTALSQSNWDGRQSSRVNELNLIYTKLKWLDIFDLLERHLRVS